MSIHTSCHILINIKFVPQGRMQIQKCSLLLCQGQQISMEEQIQQKITSNYAIQMKGSQLQSINAYPKDHHPKSVFSFKLNCSRNYNNSDKNKWNLVENDKNGICLSARMQQCKSAQRHPFKLIQEQTSPQFITRYFISPPPRKILEIRPVGRENILRNSSSLVKQSKQQCSKPCIRFVTNSKSYLNQAIDNNSKNSAETQYSSISQSEVIKDQQNYINFQALRKASQFFRLQQPHAQQQTLLNNSLLGFRPNNCIQEQIVYPSFDQLQNIQPRKFFENATTIKTIFTSNELKDQSILNSFKELATQMEKSQEPLFCDQTIKTLKHLPARNKKKTAYFGFSGKEDDTEKTFINTLKQSYDKISEEGPKYKKHSDQQRKVHFLGEPKIHCSHVEANQQIYARKQHQQAGPKKVGKTIYQPSLHNIIQSAQIQQKISIQNSIKEMPLILPQEIQEHGFRLRYIDTIKSIGGQSFKSENSYLDIKFMQNLNSRRAVVKLV